MNDLPISVPLAGASNLRDLGGWRTANGRRVRRGVVFRSASLATLTDADVDTIATLGLRTVCDLRGEREAAMAPSRLPPGVERVLLPIEPQVGGSIRDLLKREIATGEDVVGLMERAYLAYGTSHLFQYRALFDTLAQPERRPLLFHCTAGKDRTGFAAALILLALGATREAILADYAATDRLWRREFTLPPNTPAPLAEALYATHPTLLSEALDAAIAPFGDEAAFLDVGLGLDAARLSTLREVLLDSPQHDASNG